MIMNCLKYIKIKFNNNYCKNLFIYFGKKMFDVDMKK